MVSMQLERVVRLATSYEITCEQKGGKELRLSVVGHAAEDLARYLVLLEAEGIVSGPLWRHRHMRKPLAREALWAIVRLRALQAGIHERVHPHMFRAAFGTLNPATLEGRAAAMGHAHVETTLMYDRSVGEKARQAFEQMPEVEDLLPGHGRSPR